MSTIAVKNARVELKTTKEAKELLSKAAILDGLDLSSFMLAAAIEKARAILRDHTSIALSEEGQILLSRLLQAHPMPTDKMIELRSLPRLICLADLSRGLILGDSKFMKTRHGPWFLAVFYVMGITSFQAFGIGLGTEHTEQ